MFEPLREIVGRHAETLDKRMCRIESRLKDIASSNEAIALRNNWAHKYIRGDNPILLNDTGYGWRVHWVHNATAEKDIEIFWGTENLSYRLINLAAAESMRTAWYVPAGTMLIVVGLKGDHDAVTLQVELVPTPAKTADTGESLERFDVMRVPPIPNANTLNNEEPSYGQ
jgi:hypothetical protein